MWYMPSYGRPDRLRELLEAPGGWPRSVVVLINEDDPERDRYFQVLDALKITADVARLAWIESDDPAKGPVPPMPPWRIAGIAPGSRCADAHRAITMRWPDEPFYGLLCDDQWPVTPGWHDKLVEAAGDRFISTPNGEPLFPKVRNAVVLGGDLVRAMGTLVPAPVKHNYEDNIWDQVAEDFDCLRPLADVLVEHRHWIRGDAAKDETYVRGSSDIDADRRIFENWLTSPERGAMQARIAPLFNKTVSTVRSADTRLAIITPIQNEEVDISYLVSIQRTLFQQQQAGFATKLMTAAGGSHIGKARERVLWRAMRLDPKPTHLLFIDADMGWEPKLVTRLLCSGHEFSAVAGVKKQEHLQHCVNFLPEQRLHPVTKFLSVRDVGFAFVMLKLSVIEKMCAAYPELRYNAGEHEEYALFLDMIDKTDGVHGERLSEDLSFCRRWLALPGSEIWLDSQSTLIHAGRKEYTGRVADLFEFAKPAVAA